MPGQFEFDIRGGGGSRRRDDEEPMRLLLLGDFSGKPSDARPPLASRPTLRVDPDNFEQVLRRLRPRLEAPGGAIEFEELDDFHPDRLYSRLELFKSLRQARTTLPAGNDPLLGRLLGKPAEAAPAAAPAS